MAIFSEKKTASEDGTENGSETSISFSLIVLICLFGVGLSYLLSIAVITGRFIEYRLPVFLIEPSSGMIFGLTCALFMALLAGLAMQKSLNTDDSSPKSILKKSQKISYFFSLLTTLCFTAYICAVFVHLFKTGVFLSECLYLVFLYMCVLGVHFKARKSSLAHMFTSAAFVLILIVTAFYAGIASAKTENKKITYINGEPYLLVSVQKQDFILVGFDTKTGKSNGRVIILPQQNQLMEQAVFSPYRKR